MSNKSRFSKAKNYGKVNFDDALRNIIPYLYYEEDNDKNLKEIDIFDQIINSQLSLLGSVSSVVHVSAIPGTFFSSLNKAEGMAPYFVKQNNLTDIDANDFERKILLPLDKAYSDFNKCGSF